MNSLYASYAESMLAGEAPDLRTATLKVQFVDTTVYTFDPLHANYADLDGLVTDPFAIELLGIENGTLRTQEVNVYMATGVGTGRAMVLYIEGPTPEDSPLLYYMDQATGLPVTGNNSFRLIRWNGGLGQIFRLCRALT